MCSFSSLLIPPPFLSLLSLFSSFISCVLLHFQFLFLFCFSPYVNWFLFFTLCALLLILSDLLFILRFFIIRVKIYYSHQGTYDYFHSIYFLFLASHSLSCSHRLSYVVSFSLILSSCFHFYFNIFFSS
jgi:hypothetical protein